MFGLTRKLNRSVFVGLMHLSCLQWIAEFGARMHWDERWINSIRELQSFWGPALRLTNCNKEVFFSYSVRQTAKLVFFSTTVPEVSPGMSMWNFNLWIQKRRKSWIQFFVVLHELTKLKSYINFWAKIKVSILTMYSKMSKGFTGEKRRKMLNKEMSHSKETVILFFKF